MESAHLLLHDLIGLFRNRICTATTPAAALYFSLIYIPITPKKIKIKKPQPSSNFYFFLLLQTLVAGSVQKGGEKK